MTAAPTSRVIFTAKLLRVGLMLVILATVVPYGAVHPFWFYLAILLNGVIFASTLAIPFRNMDLLRVYRTTLIILLTICGYLIFQSIPLSQNPFANSIWQTVRNPLDFQGTTISVDPAGTIAGIPQIAHPFLIFMAALVLHQNNESAIVFWRGLALIGGGIAIFGVLQHLLFPHSLLLGEKQHYLDSVTGTFVNRNSAATMFGVAILVIAAILVRHFHELYMRHYSHTASHYDRRNQLIAFLSYLGIFIFVLIALFLTKSRAGLISAFFPLLLVGIWFAYSLAPSTTSRRVRIGFAVLAVAILATAFAILGARSLFRIEQSGTADHRWCVYDSTIAAIMDNPWFGTGFGTFEQVFSVYRNPECGISGIWDRAHNFFLEGYLGMGLPFAAISLVVIVYLGSVFLVGYRTRQRFRIIPLIGMGILILVVVHSMVDFSLQIPGVAAYVAATLGAATTISLVRRRSRRELTTD
jgi:O-antigen ligase